MKLTINPSVKIIVDFGGTEYTMFKPTVGVASAFEEKLEVIKTEGKPVLKTIAQYVVECGLPSEVVDQLDVEQLQEVLKVLTPGKKS